MVKKLQINLGNKTFYTLIAIIAILTIAGVVFAYNSGRPLVHGHDANEIANLPSGGGFPAPDWDSGWITPDTRTGWTKRTFNHNLNTNPENLFAYVMGDTKSFTSLPSGIGIAIDGRWEADSGASYQITVGGFTNNSITVIEGNPLYISKYRIRIWKIA